MELTTRWAQRSLNYKRKKRMTGPLLFAIVQGGTYPELRVAHAEELSRLAFDGYAVGGLAVGEPVEKMYDMLDATVPALPVDVPHYLMGVGKPEQIVEAIKRGIDMFDCVIPTRNARHGVIYIWRTNSLTGKFYDTIHIKQARYAADTKPIDPKSAVPSSRHYSRAYLRHLFMSNDPVALRLATMQNVSFYLELLRRLRRAIKGGRL